MPLDANGAGWEGCDLVSDETISRVQDREASWLAGTAGVAAAGGRVGLSTLPERIGTFVLVIPALFPQQFGPHLLDPHLLDPHLFGTPSRLRAARSGPEHPQYWRPARE